MSECAWTVEHSRQLALREPAALGDRWAHVQAAGGHAQELHAAGLIGDELVCAAWLHDIGYASNIVDTGFHPLDGARYLDRVGAPASIVALVAAHTGAAHEAAERGLAQLWAALPVPDPDQLDVLTLIDLVTSPTGRPVHPADRIVEILRRYEPSHPVHRAVTRSRPELLAAADRALTRLGLDHRWPVGSKPGSDQPVTVDPTSI